MFHIQVVHHELILSVLVLIAVFRRKLPLTALLLPHIDALLNRSCLFHLLHVLVLERNDLRTGLGTGVSLQQLLLIKGVCDADIIQGDELTTPLERLHDGQRVLLESHNVQCGRDGFCAGEFGGLAVIHGVSSDQEGQDAMDTVLQLCHRDLINARPRTIDGGRAVLLYHILPMS